MMKIKASRQIYRRLKYKNDIFDTDNIFLSKENDEGQSSNSSTVSTSSLSRTSSMEILQDTASIAKHVNFNTEVETLLIPSRNENKVYDKGMIIINILLFL